MGPQPILINDEGIQILNESVNLKLQEKEADNLTNQKPPYISPTPLN